MNSSGVVRRAQEQLQAFLRIPTQPEPRAVTVVTASTR
jgi:hypothetical protein